jgi:hypothetical protein
LGIVTAPTSWEIETARNLVQRADAYMVMERDFAAPWQAVWDLVTSPQHHTRWQRSDGVVENGAWASRTFDRSRQPADGHDFWGAGPGDTPEWYTLSENLYRGYLFFGDPLFKEFADTWLYHGYWRRFAETDAPHQVLPVHAYSHVNSFSSAAAAYLVTGDESYRQICINGYNFMLKTQCYATGATAPTSG